jgi:teichuronic acid biosynthesis glycosyltransferase TuaH
MKPLAVVCAGTAWDGMPLPDRMLGTELRHHARILWVDPPVSLVTRAEYRHGAPRSVRPRLDRPVADVIRLRPNALPLHTRPGIKQTTRTLVRAQIRWALRMLKEHPIAVVDCRMGRMLGGWGSGVLNVLYGTDDYVAGAALMGLDTDSVRRDEQACLARADLVLAVSQPLADRWRTMTGAQVELLPNGVMVDAFADVDSAPAVDGVHLPAPVVGVFGHLTERIDIALLAAVADAGLSLLLVGPHEARWEPERFAQLVDRPNVAWAGQQPFERMASYHRLIDVGITPYTDSEFNRASFPLKTLEYLAAGRPVVSTDLPATRWLETEHVRIARGPAEFVAQIRAAAAQPRTADLVAIRRLVAQSHSWRARADQAAKLIGLL